jgi:hypothetical protein
MKPRPIATPQHWQLDIDLHSPYSTGKRYSQPELESEVTIAGRFAFVPVCLFSRADLHSFVRYLSAYYIGNTFSTCLFHPCYYY